MRWLQLSKMTLLGAVLAVMCSCKAPRSESDQKVDEAFQEVQGQWPFSHWRLAGIYELLWRDAYREAYLLGRGEDIGRVKQQADQEFIEFCKAADDFRNDYMRKIVERHIQRMRPLVKD